jgi:peptidoglycan/LPS O-acetylase OafA/YrhL
MIAAGPIAPLPTAPIITSADAPVGSPARVQLHYRKELDGLRGVAILSVLAVNSMLPFFPGGFLGVDVFFVLSGFLITTLLMEEWSSSGTINLRAFYARRALRLLPALVVLLAASCLYGLVFQSREAAAVTWREALWMLFYAGNWMLAVEHEVGSLDHAWSLCVEEQFYILWPVALVLLLRFGVTRKRLLAMVFTGITLSAAWRALLWHHGAHPLRLYYGSDTRADALLVGCLLGLLFCWNHLAAAEPARRGFKWWATASAALLLGVGVSVAHDSAILYQGGFTVVALAAAGLLVESIQRPAGRLTRVLSAAPLVWMGRISYSLYLWHYPVFHVLRIERFDAQGWNPFLAHGFRFTAVFVAACGSFYLVERPFLRWKRRWSTVAA